MKLETFFKKFELLADAPNGAAKLRELVLELAVQGKLTEPSPEDEPAAELLSRITRERSRLVAERPLSPDRSSRTAAEEEPPFHPRPDWLVATIRDILLELQTGPFGSSLHQSDYREGGVPVVNPASIRDGGLVPLPRMAVGPTTVERLSTFKLRAGDIILARRGEMGRCAVVTEVEAGWLCGTGSLVLRPASGMFAPFIALLIGSPLFRRRLSGEAVGSTMQNLNQAILLRMIVALPPAAEQKRVVAKVNELMALCDRLEAQQQECETRRTALAQASLARFADAPTTANLNFLFHASYAIAPADLRRCVLALAVRGRLVPQDSDDEPAAETLERGRGAVRRALRTRGTEDRDLQGPPNRECLFEVRRVGSGRGSESCRRGELSGSIVGARSRVPRRRLATSR